LSQPDIDVRVLIIDDASPDNTAEVASELAAKDKRVLVHRHGTNKGHIATYNEGIEWASAELILLLSADDYLLPGALARAARLLDESPELGFAFGAAIVLRENGSTEMVHPLGSVVMSSEHLTMDGRTFITRNGARNIVPTPTAIVRTELQKFVGGYRRDLPHSGDMEMWMRLAAQAPVGFICDYQAAYRRHGSNMSLSYCGEHIMGDLFERKKALDAVFDVEPPMHNAGVLQSNLFRDLALNAIGEANAAFDRGNFALSAEIAHFAYEISPGCERSLPWAKLACRRIVGPAKWRALSAAKRFIHDIVRPS
jgi:glycosyltransferase involved in cell wall biosynthesis